MKKIEINNNFPDKPYLLLILFSTPGWAVSVLLFPFLPPSLSRIVGETWQGGGEARNPDESQFLPKQIRGFWKCKEILFLGIKDTIECYNGWVKIKQMWQVEESESKMLKLDCLFSICENCT